MVSDAARLALNAILLLLVFSLHFCLYFDESLLLAVSTFAVHSPHSEIRTFFFSFFLLLSFGLLFLEKCQFGFCSQEVRVNVELATAAQSEM